MKTAIRKHLRDFIAILGLVIVAAIVGGYILSNQRIYFPSWVPVLGQDDFILKGEFSTAQAITPGQGQTVDIAGVQVGEISNVQLENGRAIVTMRDAPSRTRPEPVSSAIASGPPDRATSLPTRPPPLAASLSSRAVSPPSVTVPPRDASRVRRQG